MTDEEYVAETGRMFAEMRELEAEANRLNDAVATAYEQSRQLGADRDACTIKAQVVRANMMNLTMQMLCETAGVPFISQERQAKAVGKPGTTH